jgi:hypothetical protein
MQPVQTSDWSLHTLTPLRPAVDRAERQAQAIAGLGTLAAAGRRWWSERTLSRRAV